jgi:hypothetical protein
MTYDYTPNNRNNPNNRDNLGAWAVGIVLAILLLGGAIYWGANSRNTASNSNAPASSPTTGAATSNSPARTTTGSGSAR